MKIIKQLQFTLDTVLWGDPATGPHRRIQLYFFAALFLTGIMYWVGFFNSGNLSLNAFDWVKEDAYLDTLRIAQMGQVLPWRWSEPFYHDTDKFLANPEIVLTPDIFLLRWVSNVFFIIIHVVLFYMIGFWGSCLLARKLKVRFVSFFFFWLLFNFNGHLTSQLAVGHFQWTGYFLIPFFLYYLFKFVDRSQDKPSLDNKSVISIALLFGILFLNGSVHIAVICSMFMLITLVFRWTMYPNILSSILLGFMIGSNRLLPAALWFPPKDIIGQGYPTLGSLFDAFTALRLFDFAWTQEFQVWGWWEYDFFIGFVALIVVVISVTLAVKQARIRSYLLMAAGVFTLLSLGNVYNLVNVLGIPLLNIERVPSRFFVMPFIFILVVSMMGIDELIKVWGNQVKAPVVIALVFVISELYFHFAYWRVQYLEIFLGEVEKPMLTILHSSNQSYIVSVYVGWIVSFVAFGLALIFLWRKPAQDTR